MAERIVLPDVHAYDGPLWRGAHQSIQRLGRGELTPDEYQEEIAALFDRIDPVAALAEWTERCLDEAADQILFRQTTATTTIWFQLLYLKPFEAHPPHGHRDLISNQVLLHGNAYLREYDRVARAGDDTVLLKLRTDRPMKVGDRIRTTEVDRNVHWFGTDHEPSVQLNFFIVGFQRWAFDPPERRGRVYFDPTGDVQEDGLILAKEIPAFVANEKFQGAHITSFPIRRPQRLAMAS